MSGKHWSNHDQPIDVNTAGQGTIQASRFQGRTKYKKPTESAGKPATFQGKIQGGIAGPQLSGLGIDYEGDYKRKKHRINNRQTTLFTKLLNIDKSDALKVTHSKLDERMTSFRSSGNRKAFGRLADFQSNIKMKKPYHGELHPDSKFAHGFRDNVKGERTIFMNLKLTWAKLFKKSDTQPRGMKQKVKPPRYNPNEKGLWYD